jgi:hypothetical protein
VGVAALGLLLLLGSGVADASCVSLVSGSPLVPGSSLSLTCQTSNGGTPATPGGTSVISLPTIAGSYTYGHGYGAPTGQLQGAPAGFGFYDSYVFTITDAVTNSITSTIDLGSLQVSNLQVRLYSLVGNTVPTLGLPAGTVYSAWSTGISGPGFSGTYAVIPETVLGAGTYVLEVRGNATGATGGSYSGVLNLTPVPLPGAVWLLGSGLLGFLGFARRRA